MPAIEPFGQRRYGDAAAAEGFEKNAGTGRTAPILWRVFIMLEHSFRKVYTKFKLNFYRSIFSRFETREASLTAVETFCVEVIHALRTPTISEFAKFVNISQPNATHKVQSLIKKNYVVKKQSPHDKRESILTVTDRFYQLYNISEAYIGTVMNRIRERFSPEEIAVLEKILRVMDTELMPETVLPED